MGPETPRGNANKLCPNHHQTKIEDEEKHYNLRPQQRCLVCKEPVFGDHGASDAPRWSKRTCKPSAPNQIQTEIEIEKRHCNALALLQGSCTSGAHRDPQGGGGGTIISEVTLGMLTFGPLQLTKGNAKH